MQAIERLKPGGRRKKLPSEVPNIEEGRIDIKPGQKVVIEFEATEKQEGLTSLASIDFHDLLAGKCLSGVFKVNHLTVTP